MKQQVSHRLDSELLAWATRYGESRGSSRAVVIEEALRHFQELSRGGVPDLPAAEVAVARAAPKCSASPAFADPNGSRQQRLNAAMLRARAKS